MTKAFVNSKFGKLTKKSTDYLQCTMATLVFRNCLKQCFNISDFPQPSGPTSKKGCWVPGSNQCIRVAIIPLIEQKRLKSFLKVASISIEIQSFYFKITGQVFSKGIKITPPTHCIERILNKTALPVNKTYTGLNSTLQRFRIYFFRNPRLKGVESTS